MNRSGARSGRWIFRLGLSLFLVGTLLTVGSFGACMLLPARRLTVPGSEHSNFRPPNRLAGNLLLLCLAGIPVTAVSFILLIAGGLFRIRSPQDCPEPSGSSPEASTRRS